AKLWLSHATGEKVPNRICWNQEVASEVFHFGKWVMISSICSFLLNQGDRLLLGKLFTAGELGVYSIGAMLAGLPVLVAYKLQRSVLQPAYAKSSQRMDSARFRSRLIQTRYALMACFLPYCCCLVVFSEEIINLLYDHR